MQLKHLKEFLSTLPEEFDEYDLSNGEYGKLDTESEDDRFMYRVDKPIITLYVDEDNKEILFLHQTQEEVDDIKGKDDSE